MVSLRRDREHERDLETSAAQAEPTLRQPNRFQQITRPEPSAQRREPSRFQQLAGGPRDEDDGVRSTTALDLASGRRRMDTNEFQKGLENSMRMVRQAGSATLALIEGSLGFEDRAQERVRRAQARDEFEGPMHEPKTAQFRDIDSISGFGEYMAHLAGSQAPILGTIIGSAILTRGAAMRTPAMQRLMQSRSATLAQATRAANQTDRQAGLAAAQAISRRMDLQGNTAAALGSIGGIIGVTAPEQSELLVDEDASGTVQQRAQGALASTVGAGLVGVLPVHRFLKSAGMGKKVERATIKAHQAAARDGMRLAGREPARRGLGQQLAREVPTQAGLNSVVEIAQEMSLRAAHASFREDAGMFDDEAIGRYFEAAVASFIIGGFLGTLGPTIQAATVKIADMGEGMGQLSEDVGQRIDEHQRQKMRNELFRSGYRKTQPFRTIRNIDDEMEAMGGQLTPELRQRLADIVGEQHVDATIAGASERGMSLEQLLGERLSETKGQGDDVQLLASRISDTSFDERFESALVHNIGQTIIEQFSPPQLRQALEQMDEGRRFDTEVLIGELANDLAHASDATADLVTERRTQLSELLGSDEVLDAAVETALRKDLAFRDARERLERGDDTSEGFATESDMQNRMMQRLTEEDIPRWQLEQEGMAGRTVQADEVQLRPDQRYVPRRKERAANTILNSDTFGDFTPFVRTDETGQQLEGASPAAKREATKLTNRLGIEFTARNMGDDMLELGRPEAEILDTANQILERARSAARVPAWARRVEQESFTDANQAVQFLNNFDVVSPSDTTLAQDQQIAAEGGFTSMDLVHMTRKSDASGLPRADQTTLISPSGERVTFDLVGANRTMARNLRGDRLGMNDLQVAQAALAQLMEQGFRFPTQAETRQQMRKIEKRLRTEKLTKEHREALTNQLANFRARGVDEGLSLESVVNRMRQQRRVDLDGIVDENVEVDPVFLNNLAQAMENQLNRMRQGTDQIITPDSAIGTELIARALRMAANEQFDAARSLLAELSQSEREAGGQIFDQLQEQMLSDRQAAEVVAGDLLGVDQTARQNLQEQRRMKKRLERERAKIHEMVQEAPTKAALGNVDTALKRTDNSQRKHALRITRRFLEAVLAGDNAGAVEVLSAIDNLPLRRRVSQELFLAHARITAANLRERLSRKLPQEERQRQLEIAEVLRTQRAVTQARAERVQDTRDRQSFKAAKKLEEAIEREQAKPDMRDLADREFLESASELGLVGVERRRSPGVQPNLTLHDYALYAARENQRGEAEGPFLDRGSFTNSFRATLRAHEILAQQFSVLNARAGGADALINAIAKVVKARREEWYTRMTAKDLNRGKSIRQDKLVEAVREELGMRNDHSLDTIIRAFTAAAVTTNSDIVQRLSGLRQSYERTNRKISENSEIMNMIKERYKGAAEFKILRSETHKKLSSAELRNLQQAYSEVVSAIQELTSMTPEQLTDVRGTRVLGIKAQLDQLLFQHDSVISRDNVVWDISKWMDAAETPVQLLPALSALRTALEGERQIRSERSVNDVPPMPAQRHQRLTEMANTFLQGAGTKVRIVSSLADIDTLIENNLLSEEMEFRVASVLTGEMVNPDSRGGVLLNGLEGAFRLENGEVLMYIDSTMTEDVAVLTTLHEMGHVFEAEVFSREKPETRKQILNEYARWLEETIGDAAGAQARTIANAVLRKRGATELLFGGSAILSSRDSGLFRDIIEAMNQNIDPQMRVDAQNFIDYQLGFREWFADQVADWATRNDRPRTAVERFFKQIAELFKNVLQAFKNEKLFRSEVLDAYFDSRLLRPREDLADTMSRQRDPLWLYSTSTTATAQRVLKILGHELTVNNEPSSLRDIDPLQVVASMDYVQDPTSRAGHYGIRDTINMQLTAEERNTLATVFNQNRVRDQIYELVGDDVAWLVEMEQHQDALITTGFQLWSHGLLEITPRAAGIFGKVDDFMTNKVFGELSKTDQAMEIMAAMIDGKIGQRKTLWSELAQPGSFIQRGGYGLSHAELSIVDVVSRSIKENENVPWQVIRDRLKNFRRFSDPFMSADVRQMLAKDIANGVFTKEAVAQAGRVPTWAIKPEREFAVQRVIRDNTYNQAARGVKHATAWLGDRAGLFFGQMMKARHSGNQALVSNANRLYRDVASARVTQSYDQVKTMNIAKYTNQYTSITQALDMDQQRALLAANLEGRIMRVADGDNAHVVRAQKQYMKMMREIRNHAKAAGLDIGDLGSDAGRVFVPWVFNESVFREQGREFHKFATQKKFMKHWVALAKSKDRTVDWAKDTAKLDQFIRSYIRVLGNQDGFADSDVIVDPNRQTQPHVRSMFKRELDFLFREGDATDRKTLAGFLDQDLNRIVATYINQTMKRATFNEFFGEGRQAEMEAQIIAMGGGETEVRAFRDMIDMQMGTYGLELAQPIQKLTATVGKWFGKDWSELDPATYRRVQGYVVTYQNIRTLSFAAMTNAVDAAGLLVRSGSMSMALQGLKQGYGAMRKDAKGKIQNQALAEMAEMLGVAEKVVVQDALGQLYGGVHFTGTAAKINDTFFKYNGMMALNRFLRMSALGTAHIYLKKHAALARHNNKESAKLLTDIGLLADDLIVDDTGNIQLLSDDRITELSHGLRPGEIQQRIVPREKIEGIKDATKRQMQLDFHEVLRDQRVRDAMFRFVDEAVMRPSAMQRPSWGNDPNWGVFFHLKAFMYTYHERHLRRALNKLGAEGNAGPLVMMMSFVGLMFAVDLLREVVQHGPDGDPRKDDWGAWDYSFDAAHRSGVFGAANYIPDFAKTMELRSYRDPVSKYTSPLIEVGGPAVSQFDQVMRATFLGERRARARVDALPANNLFRALQNWGNIEPMSDRAAFEAITQARFAPDHVREQARRELEKLGN